MENIATERPLKIKVALQELWKRAKLLKEAHDKIVELELQLKTARRDAIHDAIKATMVKIEGGHAKIHKTSDLEAFADSQLKD